VTASETAWPSGVLWGPGLVTTGGRSTLPTVQVKVTLLLRRPSEAVTVTLYVPAAVNGRVPVISPLVVLMLSPGGRPLALKVRVSPSESFATIWRATVWPSGVFCVPGLVITGG